MPSRLVRQADTPSQSTQCKFFIVEKGIAFSALPFGLLSQACHTYCCSPALRHSTAYCVYGTASLRYVSFATLKKDSFAHSHYAAVSTAISTAVPPCNRHLPFASGTGTKPFHLQGWHKPTLICMPRPASHVVVTATPTKWVPAVPPACSMAEWWRTVSIPSVVPSSSMLPCQLAVEYTSTVDYSHYGQ